MSEPVGEASSKRMIFWLVAVPCLLLSLVVAGVNWRVFHLAYCRHLTSSEDPEDRFRGLQLVAEYQLRKGMSAEEVRRLVAPLEMKESSAMDYHVEVRFSKTAAKRLEFTFHEGKYHVFIESPMMLQGDIDQH